MTPTEKKLHKNADALEAHGLPGAAFVNREAAAKIKELMEYQALLVKSLGACCDIFPLPEHGSASEDHLASAMSDPECVLDYVRECVKEKDKKIEGLTGALQFVERWAVHHGSKSDTPPGVALSVIQHYPPIAKITAGYADGKTPDTFNPFAALKLLEEDLDKAQEELALCNSRNSKVSVIPLKNNKKLIMKTVYESDDSWILTNECGEHLRYLNQYEENFVNSAILAANMQPAA